MAVCITLPTGCVMMQEQTYAHLHGLVLNMSGSPQPRCSTLHRGLLPALQLQAAVRAKTVASLSTEDGCVPQHPHMRRPADRRTAGGPLGGRDAHKADAMVGVRPWRPSRAIARAARGFENTPLQEIKPQYRAWRRSNTEHVDEHVNEHVDSCSQVVRGEELKAIYNGTTPRPSLPGRGPRVHQPR
ncbi:unnamed protein product [Rangifer tarandus platyrhynchus]|uniref:Uncharacterized protein n=3 Tax=Rangifer tarandus platyrhynchus TaxID=3082113 RepID=A0ABN8ZEB5_RANTA|nr:unnamed protein product [Rangifer tarandus platyrhynchus]CAI9705901.1 unnamed protein product [Rangifer tarandus platyrhynchus]